MTLLSKSFIKSIAFEIKRLRAEREVIDCEISRLESLARGAKQRKLSIDIGSAGSELASADTSVGSELGFKDRLLKVLEDRPKGLRPIEVTDFLRKSGFQLSGKTALSMRVAGELARMNKIKVLRRTRGGLYRLREATN